MSCPPFKGGQGREDESIERDGTPSVLTVLAVLAFLLMLAERCAR